MPSNDLSIKIVANRFPDLMKQFPQITDRIVQSTALKIEAQAKVAAPVDTGALRNSIRAVKTGEGKAEVRVGVKYGAYVEYGARGRGPKPFLGPAANREKPAYLRALGDLEKELK
jgi:HK97 gp10 family phage protein